MEQHAHSRSNTAGRVPNVDHVGLWTAGLEYVYHSYAQKHNAFTQHLSVSGSLLLRTVPSLALIFGFRAPVWARRRPLPTAAEHSLRPHRDALEIP